MSKVAMPRPRYIAVRFACAVPVTRRAFGTALSAAAGTPGAWTGPPPQLTRFGGDHAIVRAEHSQTAALRILLARIDAFHADGVRHPAQVVPLSTSGTLLALTNRLGILRERTK